VSVTPAASDSASPVLSLSPASGPIGTKVNISACNMTPGNIVNLGNITFAGEPWNPNPIVADSSGCVCATRLIVPTASPGVNSVVVKDGNITLSGVFTVTLPDVVISPTSGYMGQMIMVTGSGWPQDTSGVATVTLNGLPVGRALLTPSGTFSMQFTIPLTVGTTCEVGAGDLLGNTAPVKLFSLEPTALSISPSEAASGTSVVVSGSGFQPYSYVEELRFTDSIISTDGLMTNEVGSFSTTVTVPGLYTGACTVSATVAGFTIAKCFSVIDPEPGEERVELVFPIESALDCIRDKVIVVWGFDNGEWYLYSPEDPIGSDLTGLVMGRAYWVKVSEDCTLGTCNLKSGWNNIGW